MTYYAVIGRIPFDDEDSIMFYESDEENPPLAEWFELDMYTEDDRGDMEEVHREHGTTVFITAVLKSASPIE